MSPAAVPQDTNAVAALSPSDLAIAWLTAKNDESNAGKLMRAAEKRRKEYGEELERRYNEGDRIQVEGRGVFRYFLKNNGARTAWKEAFTNSYTYVNAAAKRLMDTAKDANTKDSTTPSLEAVPVNE